MDLKEIKVCAFLVLYCSDSHSYYTQNGRTIYLTKDKLIVNEKYDSDAALYLTYKYLDSKDI